MYTQGSWKKMRWAQWGLMRCKPLHHCSTYQGNHDWKFITYKIKTIMKNMNLFHLFCAISNGFQSLVKLPHTAGMLYLWDQRMWVLKYHFGETYTRGLNDLFIYAAELLSPGHRSHTFQLNSHFHRRQSVCLKKHLKLSRLLFLDPQPQMKSPAYCFAAVIWE